MGIRARVDKFMKGQFEKDKKATLAREKGKRGQTGTITEKSHLDSLKKADKGFYGHMTVDSVRNKLKIKGS